MYFIANNRAIIVTICIYCEVSFISQRTGKSSGPYTNAVLFAMSPTLDKASLTSTEKIKEVNY